MQLYALKAEYDNVLAICNAHAAENEGEIPESLDAALEAICGTLQDKAVNCALLVKNCLGEAAAIKCEEDKLRARRKVAENTADRVKTYLAAWIPAGTKISEARCTIGWRKSSAVIIDNDMLVPDALCEIERSVSKTAVKEAIQSGNVVAGAHIEDRLNISIK